MNKRTKIISCAIGIGLIVLLIVGLTGRNAGQSGKEAQNVDSPSQSTVTVGTTGPNAEQQSTDASSVDTEQKKNSANTNTGQKSADSTDSESELEEEDIVYSSEGLELPPERIEGTQGREQGGDQDRPQSTGQGSAQQGQNPNDQNQPQGSNNGGQQTESNSGSTGNQEILPGGEVEMPAIPIRR